MKKTSYKDLKVALKTHGGTFSSIQRFTKLEGWKLVLYVALLNCT